MGQLGMAGISDEAAARFLEAQGLPRRAAEDPDFPLTLAQELAALQAMLRQAPRAPGEIIQAFSLIGVNHYGVLGLAMQHAPTLLVALERLLALPELSWGHCRITVLSYPAGAVVQFEPPILPGGDSALSNYCLWKDLFSILRVILDVLGPAGRPQEIGLPGPPLGSLDPFPRPCALARRRPSWSLAPGPWSKRHAWRPPYPLSATMLWRGALPASWGNR